MAAARRQLARLPLEIFQPFGVEGGTEDAPAVRQAICQKLQSFPRKSPHPRATQPAPCNNYEEVRSVGALLQLSVPSLVEALDPLLTYEQCHELLLRISQHCVPSPVTAWSLLQSQEKEDRHLLPTSLPALDRHLRGGLRIGSITELVGSAGIGKTQWALTLVVQAALEQRRGSIYIDTEDKLSLVRLREIAQQRCGGDDAGRCPAVLANVTLQSLHTTDELLACLQSLDEQILLRNHPSQEETARPPSSSYPVGLVVVDSVAAPLLRDYGSGAAAPQRASRALACAQLLQRWADQCGVAVVVINQIDHHHHHQGRDYRGGAAPPPTQIGTASDPSQDRNSALPPAALPQASLGTAWHHCVSTRIVLQAPVGEGIVPRVGDGGGPHHHTRTATVTKSHVVAPAGPFPYEIRTRGIVEATFPTVGAVE